MKKNGFLLSLFIALLFGLTIQSCGDDDEEFVATDSTFANFSTWSLDAVEQGTDNAVLGAAHGGSDSSIVRNIYFKDGVDPEDGEYAVGSVIVKHMTNAASNPADSLLVNAYFGMVKRGADFDATAGNWEYFILAENGAIAEDADGNSERGDSSYKACGSCHAAASSSDYIFSK